MESKNFVVYKSSAGSGKTYTLVKEYLKLVLVNPSRVRNILAITFTNAASAEMKERIIKALAEVVNFKKGYFDNDTNEAGKIKDLVGQIISETSLDENTIYDNSEKVLYNILHNYNDFSISTIDSFTHRILRTFAFDLQIPANFEIEFDAQKTIEQAADILVSRTGAGSNPELTNLLVRFVESRADEERSFAIEREIIQMAEKMLNEDSIHYIAKLKDKDIADFMKAYGTMKKKLDDFQNKLCELSDKGLSLIENAGIKVNSLAYGKNGIYSWFKKLSAKQIDKSLPPNKNICKILNENKWHSAKAKEENDLEAINNIASELQSISDQIVDLSEKKLSEYFLLDNVRNNLFSLALINEMEKIMDDIRWEENILFIADFNKKISDFIAHETVPFIYERVGEKYHNYMIDEFQDTSMLQWQNMLPLVENSLATGNMSLLVGDAKQSIYRWRGGDAQQFIKLPELTNKIYSVNKEQVEKTLKANYHQIPKNPEEGTVNYRSLENIVKFNNDFFETIKSSLPDLVQEVYHGHKQQGNKPGSGGSVEVSFIPEVKGEKEKFEKETVEKVQSIIEELVSNKYTYQDIAVLCRKKREAAAVAEHLTRKGLYVVSEESLLLTGSSKVNFLIALLKIINNPADNTSLTECVDFLIKANLITQPGNLHLCLKEVFLANNENKKSNKDNFERFIGLLEKNSLNLPSTFFAATNVYELLEDAVRLFFPSQKSICPYLTFFFDYVHEYLQTRQNSIPGFLRFWDEKKDDLSLVMPDKLNAVKVITIHKSKGLQFPVVIYPFAREASRSNIDDGFWIDFEDRDMPGLKVAYIAARKTLLETNCSDLYAEEEDNKMLDLINLTYVAFTRPQERLFVISAMPENGGNFPKKSLNTILYEYLKTKGLWKEDKTVYTFPEKIKEDEKEIDETKKSLKEDEPGVKWLEKYINQPWKNKVTARIIGEPYEQEKIKRVARGSAVHKAMENIFTEKDIPVVVNQLVAEGHISRAESESLEKNLSDLLNNSLIKSFFSENSIIKTEPGIFDDNGNFYRPDRIAFLPEQTAVLEYKTGKPQEKYKYQIRRYGKLLEKMNYKSLRLFIVYIDQNIIEEIEHG